MARPRWQGDEGEARREDQKDADTMRALGYPEADIVAETRRREQVRFDAFNSRQILAAFVPPLPRGHQIDPNTELHEILLPCHECGRAIEHEDSDHEPGCRYYAAPVEDWR